MAINFTNMKEFHGRCFLCLEPIDGSCVGHIPNDRIDPVTHAFHRSCLWGLFGIEKKNSCPRCLSGCEVLNASNYTAIPAPSRSPLERGRVVAIAAENQLWQIVRDHLFVGPISEPHLSKAIAAAHEKTGAINLLKALTPSEVEDRYHDLLT